MGSIATLWRSALRLRTMAAKPTLDNPEFVGWLMGPAERIAGLREHLQGVHDSKARCIVLTNGFAKDATFVLKQIGLANFFSAVCDTRGTVVVDPDGAQSEMEIEDGVRYSKEQFMETA